jgi:hypothetical protein
MEAGLCQGKMVRRAQSIPRSMHRSINRWRGLSDFDALTCMQREPGGVGSFGFRDSASTKVRLYATELRL